MRATTQAAADGGPKLATCAARLASFAQVLHCRIRHVRHSADCVRPGGGVRWAELQRARGGLPRSASLGGRAEVPRARRPRPIHCACHRRCRRPPPPPPCRRPLTHLTLPPLPCCRRTAARPACTSTARCCSCGAPSPAPARCATLPATCYCSMARCLAACPSPRAPMTPRRCWGLWGSQPQTCLRCLAGCGGRGRRCTGSRRRARCGSGVTRWVSLPACPFASLLPVGPCTAQGPLSQPLPPPPPLRCRPAQPAAAPATRRRRTAHACLSCPAGHGSAF